MTAGHNMAIFTDCDFFMNSVNFLEVNFPPKTDFVPVFFLSRPHAKTTYISVIKKRLYAEFSLGVEKHRGSSDLANEDDGTYLCIFFLNIGFCKDTAIWPHVYKKNEKNK